MNWRKPLIYLSLYLMWSKIPKNLKEILKLNKVSERELKKYQEEKLKKIILHCWKSVPYYKSILEERKIVIDGKINLKKFDRLPYLTKDIIRNNFEGLHTKKLGWGWHYNTSGGSTGEPVKFIQDKYYLDWEIANKIWYKLIANQDIGEKELRFWGSERDLLEGKETLKIRFRNWLYNRREFNTFKMSEKEMFEYVKEWNKYNPSWVESYVQSIYEFAKFIEENKLEIHSPKNGILTSAGTLFPEMKETLERVSKCPVYNRYGSREVGDMACGRDKLKLSLWNHYLEVIDNKIYVTTLNNFSMPLIRYEIGDLGKISKDKMYLEKVEGRVTSVVKTRNGKIIPAEFFIHFIGVVYNTGGIRKFQVIQDKIDSLIIRVVIQDKKEFESCRPKIESAIKKEIAEKCKIQWKIVKKIEPLKSGKYEYVRSEVK